MASWEKFLNWAETFGIASMAQLADAPLRIQKMLKKGALRIQIINYFRNMKGKKRVNGSMEIPIYANKRAKK